MLAARPCRRTSPNSTAPRERAAAPRAARSRGATTRRRRSWRGSSIARWMVAVRPCARSTLRAVRATSSSRWPNAWSRAVSRPPRCFADTSTESTSTRRRSSFAARGCLRCSRPTRQRPNARASRTRSVCMSSWETRSSARSPKSRGSASSISSSAIRRFSTSSRSPPRRAASARHGSARVRRASSAGTPISLRRFSPRPAGTRRLAAWSGS